MMIKEPSYRSSRRYLWGSFYLAWALIFVLAGAAAYGSEQAVAFAQIAVPSMVLIITGVLGIHRFSGSMDFKAQAEAFEEQRGSRS